MCSSNTLPTEGIGSGGRGGGFSKTRTLKNCMMLNLNSRKLGRGGGGLGKNPFHGVGRDIFWNKTIS